MQLTTYFSQLCQHCGVENIEALEEESEESILITLKVSEEDAGLLIGHHGETIQALQKLARASFGRSTDPKRLFINVNDYRQQREEKLRNILITTAQRALDSQRPVTFPMYLPASERFFVHTELALLPEFAALESVSVGDGISRRLVVQPKVVAES